MTTPNRKGLLKALEGITGTGVFCAAESAPFFPPGMLVEGAGEIGFPLAAAQARELIALAEAAPYGKGLDTVRDDRVRRCWQFDASKVSFDNPEWAVFLKRTVASVAETLGVEGKVVAEPYKVLLYEKGGHFLPHRDTEKLDAMFGTLIIALPSAHTGGHLRVRHAGHEVAVDFSGKPGRTRFQYAAFFADCEHEVAPVEEGVRFCLVYNLRLAKGDPSALNASVATHAKSLGPSLRKLQWENPPQPLVLLLEHQYTEANFALANLKGHDSARARALLAAAPAAGLVPHLALVTLHQSGSLDGDAGYGRSYYDDDDEGDEEFSNATMGEVFEENLTASHWRNAEDEKAPLPAVDLSEACLLTHDPLGEGEPDEKDAEGYTGNAGCTMDYWYRRGAVVLWPLDRHEAALCSLSFPAACATLRQQARKPSTRNDPGFGRLLRAVLDHLPDHAGNGHPHGEHEEPDAVREKSDPTNDPCLLMVLDSLLLAKEERSLKHLVHELPKPAFCLVDAVRWAKLVTAFGMSSFEPLVSAVLGEPGGVLRTTGFRLLRAAVAAGDTAGTRRLALGLAGLPPRPARSAWSGSPTEQPGSASEIGIMLCACTSAGTDQESQRLLEFLRGDGSLGYVREHLAPALLRWASETKRRDGLEECHSAGADAWRFARMTLNHEIQRELRPPANWTRPFTPPKSPGMHTGWHRRAEEELTRELADFMASPTTQTHIFARRADERQIIENWVHQQRLDVDCVTINKGSPHKLVCTKNTASHAQAMNTREADRRLAATLALLA